jgi:hypothetical protein
MIFCIFSSFSLHIPHFEPLSEMHFLFGRPKISAIQPSVMLQHSTSDPGAPGVLLITFGLYYRNLDLFTI